MSQDKRNSKRKDKSGFDVGLTEVCGFLRFIWVAAGAIFLLALMGLLLFNPGAAAKVAYQLTALCCGIAAIGGYIACHLLEKKEEELSKKELENKIIKKSGTN